MKTGFGPRLHRIPVIIGAVGLLGWLGLSAYLLHKRSRPIRFAEPLPSVAWATIQPVVLEAHDGAVTDAEFSPDDRWMVTASDDHTARVWEFGWLTSRDKPREFACYCLPKSRWLCESGKHRAG